MDLNITLKGEKIGCIPPKPKGEGFLQLICGGFMDNINLLLISVLSASIVPLFVWLMSLIN